MNMFKWRRDQVEIFTDRNDAEITARKFRDALKSASILDCRVVIEPVIKEYRVVVLKSPVPEALSGKLGADFDKLERQLTKDYANMVEKVGDNDIVTPKLLTR